MKTTEMNMPTKLLFLTCLLLTVGCQQSSEVANDSTETPVGDPSVKLVSQVVEASCGECKFDMEGNGCDLAVRIDGKGYYVDGAKMDDHGDAHGEDGMCNRIRKAKVTGQVQDSRFVATAFELLPSDEESAPHDHDHDHDSEPHSH